MLVYYIYLYITVLYFKSIIYALKTRTFFFYLFFCEEKQFAETKGEKSVTWETYGYPVIVYHVICVWKIFFFFFCRGPVAVLWVCASIDAIGQANAIFINICTLVNRVWYAISGQKHVERANFRSGCTFYRCC